MHMLPFATSGISRKSVPPHMPLLSSKLSMRSILTIHRAGDKFRGEYHHDEVRDMITGNPARAANIQDMLDSIQKREKAGGAARNHAQAITIEDMKKLMEWSLQEVPMSAINRSFDDDTKSLAHCAWHFLI
jgi:hypothetical protein